MEWLTPIIAVIPNWPPNSPDLSVIENVSGILKRKISARRPENIAQLTGYLLEEWENLDQGIINDLMESMNQRIDRCMQDEGKSIGHLVRNSAHPTDTVLNIDPPAGVLAIRQVKAKHIGTSVLVSVRVTEIRRDQANPALIWVELEDHARYSKGDQCRKIGMMALEEEAPLFPSDSELLFIVEVQGANPQFIGNPERPKTATKLKIYLRFVAIHETGDPEWTGPMVPSLDEEADESEEEIAED
jgi:hypothetical protein